MARLGGVLPLLKDDVRRAQAAAVLVVVDGGADQVAEGGEELLDVLGVHGRGEVGDVQGALTSTTTASTKSSTTFEAIRRRR